MIISDDKHVSNDFYHQQTSAPLHLLTVFTPYPSTLVLIPHKLLEESLRRGKLPSIDGSGRTRTSSIRAALSSQSFRSRSRSRSQSRHTLSLSQPLPNNRHLSISSSRSCPHTPRAGLLSDTDKVTTDLFIKNATKLCAVYCSAVQQLCSCHFAPSSSTHFNSCYQTQF